MNEELDELASAYVDGEVTDAERARVESDPVLLSIVAEFRALKDAEIPLPDVDVDLRERHLATALDAFDGLFVGTAENPITTEQAPAPEEGIAIVEEEDASKVVPLSRGEQRRLPRWLMNAAAAVVLLGGIGFALNQLPERNGGDSVGETASVARDTQDLPPASAAAQEAGDAAEEASAAGAADEAADDAMADAMASDEMAPQALADDAGADSADTAAAPDLELSGPVSATGVLAEAREQLAAEGLPFEAILHPLEMTPNCAGVLDPAALGQSVGFVRILLDGTLTELFVNDASVTGDDDVGHPLLVDADSCVVLSDE